MNLTKKVLDELKITDEEEALDRDNQDNNWYSEIKQRYEDARQEIYRDNRMEV